MSRILLNVSGKISPAEVEVFDTIHNAFSELGISYLVVGASARDLVFHHAHGVHVIRSTGDIDFGIQVESWGIFLALKAALLDKQFRETNQNQRLISPSGIPIDIVPFGAIEDDKARINWPPEGDIEMLVLGFREAHKHADLVRVRNRPPLDIPVVSMPGLSILKIISWTNRTPDIRKKDAIDLLFLLKSYERIPSVQDAIFDVEGLSERYGFDLTIAGAYLLGIHATEMILPNTAQYLSSLVADELAPHGIERLVEEMSNDDDQFERNLALLKAYFAGLNTYSST